MPPARPYISLFIHLASSDLAGIGIELGDDR